MCAPFGKTWYSGFACLAKATDSSRLLLLRLGFRREESYSVHRMGDSPQTMVIMNADNGNIITALPIGNGVNGALFNPMTMEAFSSQRDGTLTVVKENSPTSFVVEQTVQTKTGAKTLTLDTKTNQILLITAEYGPPPPPPPAGGRGGRAPMLPDSFQILVVGK